ncbi:hypothetical protein [Nocardia paucivorans]|nr:hypothetical protein [Nocardia paucivorans]
MVMDLATAHLAMRTHIDCWSAICPPRRQAEQHLVEAGRLVPRVEWPNMG